MVFIFINIANAVPLLRIIIIIIIIIIIKIITTDYFNIVVISIFKAKVSLTHVIIFFNQGCVEGLKDFVNNHLLILGVIAVSVSAIQVRNERRVTHLPSLYFTGLS